jgi:hypothetical protein
VGNAQKFFLQPVAHGTWHINNIGMNVFSGSPYHHQHTRITVASHHPIGYVPQAVDEESVHGS